METVGTLKDRYTDVRARIGRAAERAGRKASDVLLVAVTKYAEPDQVRELIRLGHIDLGESKVQQLVQRAAMTEEWLARFKAMPNTHAGAASAGVPLLTPPVQVPRRPAAAAAPQRTGGRSAAPRDAPRGGESPPADGHDGSGVRWHMIGRLQRNKVRKAVETCRLIHSVDSLRLAEEIQAAAGRKGAPDRVTEVLLQVNITGRGAQGGCAIAAAIHLAEQIDTMVQVRLRGLMTIAPPGSTPDVTRDVFSRTRELFFEVRDAGISEGHFNILSMGMSGDFEIAIEEGANVVRVGSALFGDPPPGAEDEDEADED